MTSQTTTSIAPRSTLRRFAYATLAALLFTTIVFEASRTAPVTGRSRAFHVALDRAIGYGLRARDGFQRP